MPTAEVVSIAWFQIQAKSSLCPAPEHEIESPFRPNGISALAASHCVRPFPCAANFQNGCEKNCQQGYFFRSDWRQALQFLFCSVEFLQPVFHVPQGAEQAKPGLGQIETSVE